ncbi:MAG: PDZ domain-containing protein, partial [Planctomycetota bacterium]
SKASEVKKANRLRGETSNGRLFDAKIVATDYENDIALLKVDAENLIPVVWDNTQPTSGSFVVVPNPQGNVISLGTFSVIPRSTIGENHGFLGVAPQTVSEGVQIVDDIKYDTAAFEAGLKVGDIITNIDGKEVRETVELVDEIRKRQAGDKITIDFIRAGNRNRTVAKLAGQSLSATRAARFKMMSRLGAIPSSRNSDFPSVFQHDSPLFPEQCGGPICDLNGNVLGINIARESRAASYAIPSNKIEAVVDRLLLREVAFRKSISR